MAITLTFEPKPGADAHYDDVIEELQKDSWPPEGMLYHVASGTGAEFRVVEVWESEQLAKRFGERLMPILQKHGIELSGPPRAQPVIATVQAKAGPTA
jgi:hypothetical protein